MSRFAKLAWAALAYNLMVIVWGAYVRASGSGAGCGAHWPLCNGDVVPRAPAVKTLIEFSHRLSSGLVLIVALVMLVASLRTFGSGSPVRRGAIAVFVLTLAEAALGAGLVLFKLVAHDDSMARALSMSLHLVNTFFLLAALTFTAAMASRHDQQSGANRSADSASEDGVQVEAPANDDALDRGTANAIPDDAPRPALLRALLIASAVAILLVGTSGGIAALGDTLFPSTSFAEGLRQEMGSGAHILLRLRILHPMFAITSGFVLMATGVVARSTHPSRGVVRWSRALSALVILQLCLGLANVALLAPVWMQLVHLLAADAVWIALVLLATAVRFESLDYERTTTRLRPARFAS